MDGLVLLPVGSCSNMPMNFRTFIAEYAPYTCRELSPLLSSKCGGIKQDIYFTL